MNTGPLTPRELEYLASVRVKSEVPRPVFDRLLVTAQMLTNQNLRHRENVAFHVGGMLEAEDKYEDLVTAFKKLEPIEKLMLQKSAIIKELGKHIPQRAKLDAIRQILKGKK